MNYSEEHADLTKVAWMYYVQGRTQEEISKELKSSRIKITRMLAKAREVGIVEININSRFRACFDIEKELKSLFGLSEVLVVPSGRDLEETRRGLGIRAASYINLILKDGDTIGCAWGRCQYEIGNSLSREIDKNLHVIQMMGGLNLSGQVNPQAILELIARNLGAEGIWLNTPAIVGNKEIRNVLLTDENVKKTLKLAEQSNIALLGIGDVSATASLLRSKAITETEMEELKKKGAVGDLLGRFYDITGKEIEHPITERVIALELEAMKNIPVKIASTVGSVKVQAIVGGLRGKYFNILITDEDTAKQVLSFVRGKY